MKWLKRLGGWLISALVWVFTAKARVIQDTVSILRENPEFERQARAAYERDQAEGGNRHMHRVLARWGQ